MSAERVLQLFDSFWFHCAIFMDKPASPPPPPPPPPSSATRPSREDEDDRRLLETKLSRVPTLHVRSMSDQFLGGVGLNSDPFSPTSVLLAATTKLQTILSGKEVSDFEGEGEGEHETTKSEGETEGSQSQTGSRKKSENVRRKKKRSKSSKSLSELEFQELKGFMDLGFVFSEKDKDDSDLVSILPGLQRLGLRDDGYEIEVKEKKADEIKVSRPYLSEAWEVWDRQRKRYDGPLVNWTVPALGNEMAMKDHLRSWAHTVASTVR